MVVISFYIVLEAIQLDEFIKGESLNREEVKRLILKIFQQ